MEKVQVNAEVEKAEVMSGSEPFKWPLQDRLLSSFLGVVMENRTLPSDEIKGMFWGDSGLRANISANLDDPLIRDKKILNKIPTHSRHTVREFLEEFLVSGGKISC